MRVICRSKLFFMKRKDIILKCRITINVWRLQAWNNRMHREIFTIHFFRKNHFLTGFKRYLSFFLQKSGKNDSYC
jgi:hypothetical protein